MRVLLPLVAFLAVAPAHAQPTFERPDCSAFAGAPKPEVRCYREIRHAWQEMNFAALQKTGLMFVYMERPDIESAPEAREVIERKVEGSFLIRFSVATDGRVSEVKVEEVTAGIEPLAKLWADTIRQWTFVKVERPVSGVEYRRIYLYPKDEAKQHDERVH